MAKPLGFMDFLNVDYTRGGDEQQARNAKKRKLDIGAGTNAEYSSTNPPKEQEEALDISQRRKRAQQMKRMKSRIAIGRKRKQFRPLSAEDAKKRANKAARKKILSKMLKGRNYQELSPSEKATWEKKLEKKKGVIQKLAKKMLPQIRKADKEKKRNLRKAKSEK